MTQKSLKDLTAGYRGQELIIDILEAGIEAAFPFFDRMTGTTCFTGAVSETGGLDKMSLQLSAPKNESRLRLKQGSR
jgi:hypothetical protein